MPVDIASGAVELEIDDIDIPGEVDLVWARRYSTSLLDNAISPIGRAWTSRYFATLTRRPGEFEFVTADGTVQMFPDPEGSVDQGQVVRDLGAFLELFREGGRYLVQQWDVDTDEVIRYCFRADQSTGQRRLSSIESETSQGLDLIWDDRSRLTEVRQRVEGRSLVIGYSAAGVIERIALRARNHQERLLLRYEHDANQRLVTAYDAAGVADRYEYDARGRLTREIVKDGGVFTYRYDERDRCIRMSGVDRYQEKRLRFLDAAHFTEVTDSYDQTFRYERLPSGQIVRVIDPLGREKRTEYDAEGRIVSESTAAGPSVQYTYDEAGNRSTIVDALGHARAFTYNRSHLPVTMVDPMQGLWRREYDELFRLTSTIDPLGGRWTVRYNPDGTVAEMNNPLGAHKTWDYDRGVVRAATDWFGNVTSFRFDAMGRIVEMLEPLNVRTSYEFDAVGNVLVVRLPDGTIRGRQYDVAGNMTSLIDGNGHVTAFRYGPCRRLLERVDAMGRSVRYEWGREPDRLVSIENENGERYQFEYDTVGRLSREVDVDGLVTSYEYDDNDNVTALVVGELRTVLRRDAIGRLIAKVAPGITAEYAYNPNGYLIAARNTNADVQFDYDAGGGLVGEVQRVHVDAFGGRAEASFRFGYRLNGVNDRVQTTLPSGDVLTTRRDGGSQWLDEAWNGAPLAATERDALRRQVAHTLGSPEVAGLALRRERDPVSRVTSAQFISQARVVSRSDFTYDAEGLLTTRRDSTRGASAYQYDRSGRLEAAQQPELNERFRFDPAGNPLDPDLPPATDPSAATGAAAPLSWVPGNRLRRYKDRLFEYDERGNPVRIVGVLDEPSSMRLEYDAENQLVKVVSQRSVEAAYYYDPLGRRVAKAVKVRGPLGSTATGTNGGAELNETANQTLTLFAWDGDALALEVRPQETVTYLREPESFVPMAQIHVDIQRTRYAQGGEDPNAARGDRTSSDQPAPTYRPALERVYYINTDHLGTPQEAVTAAGRIAWMAYYQAWGRVRNLANREITQPFRFQGQYEDVETGLFYNRYRYYDPETGRYLTKDPIGFGGLDKNFYRYAINPTVWIDPRGLTGTYIFELADGSTYVGKGPEDRMQASMKERSEQKDSPVVGAAHTDFGDEGTKAERKDASRKGFLTEHELMQLEKFGEADSKLLNEIASPGKTREPAPPETAAAKRAAKALQRKLEADKKKRAAEAKKAKGKGC